MQKRIHPGRLIAVVAAALLVTAACSSKSNSTGTGAAPAAGSTPAAANASAPAGGGATIQAASNALGTILTDGKGHTVYVFAPDTTSSSTCYDICAKYWPPVLSSGAPTAGSGIDASKLSTSARKDGSKQVTYNGHPLYTFALDKSAGDAKGQGMNQDGGLWWVVGTDGNAIKGSGSGSASTSSPAATTSGGGYTY